MVKKENTYFLISIKPESDSYHRQYMKKPQRERNLTLLYGQADTVHDIHVLKVDDN